jgi:(p)ppGpp synthase/HD superfamily hydrolase
LTDLSDRFGQALLFALQLHRNQSRKGNQTPYIAHLLGVASLVLEDGGDEDEAIAALLHDAPEDQGGRETLEAIRSRFGERVAQIVDGCTDTYETPKPPWRERKEGYLRHLRVAPPSVWRVSLADKLHNARTILADLRAQGEQVWERFNGGKSGSLWYYRALVNEFEQLYATQEHSSPMVVMLAETVARIEALSGQEGCQDSWQ